MQAFYSDHFVLPLPEGHKFPMAKYSRLRERILAEGVVPLDALTEAPAVSWDDLRLVHTAGVRRRRGHRHACHAKSSGASAFPGRPEWSSARAARWAPPSPRRTRRSTPASGPTSPAARITRSRIAGRASACSTTSPWPRGCCNVTGMRGASPSSISTCTRATGRPRSSTAIRSVFTFSMHGEKNFPFKKETSHLDVALADGTGDADYLAALERHLPLVLERTPAGFHLLPRGRGPVRGRPPRAPQADDRRPAPPGRDPAPGVPPGGPARGDLDERRLRHGHRRHRHHSRQHDPHCGATVVYGNLGI